ncbi:hypothetical protein [Rhodococcus opacus]|uniref:hypothetical protein n=1 Tax=Rhodococcus opacus TaxID=37919 RepID=UPI0029538A1B|nr:hypothetical protein [Rhodococcus opacus]
MNDPERMSSPRGRGAGRVRVTAPSTRTDVDLDVLLRRMDSPEKSAPPDDAVALWVARRRLALTVAVVYAVLLGAGVTLTPLREAAYLGLPVQPILICVGALALTLGCVRWFMVADRRLENTWTAGHSKAHR